MPILSSTSAIITISTAALVALVVSLIYTPMVRRLALKYGFVDHPDGKRKIHTDATALGGGYAILIAGLLGVVVATIVARYITNYFEAESVIIPRRGSLAGLALASIVLCVVGLLDDRFTMRGGIKLVWQIIAASLVIFVGSGLQIDKILLFGFMAEFGLAGQFVGLLFAMVWLLGAINSVNLMDGVDGLASTIGLIFSITLGAMAIMTSQNSTNHMVDAMIAFSMAGALLGFLRYNFAPAKIYLGDAGSMLIGLVLGTIALRCSIKEATTVAFAGPLAIMAIPMFDSLAAILRRKLTGRSIYASDRGHIHHRLLTRGLSHRQAVLLIGALCGMTACGSLASVYFANEMLGILVVVSVLILMVGARIFGHVELLLLNNRLLGFGRSFLTYATNNDSDAHHGSVQLQGSREWEDLWEAIIDSAERFHLIHIRLNLVLPHLHEDFYATWSRKSRMSRDLQWHTTLPLIVDGELIGRLEVSGAQESESAATILSQYLDFLEPMENHLRLLLHPDTGMEPMTEEDAPMEKAVSQDEVFET